MKMTECGASVSMEANEEGFRLRSQRPDLGPPSLSSSHSLSLSLSLSHTHTHTHTHTFSPSHNRHLIPFTSLLFPIISLSMSLTRVSSSSLSLTLPVSLFYPHGFHPSTGTIEHD